MDSCYFANFSRTTLEVYGEGSCLIGIDLGGIPRYNQAKRGLDSAWSARSGQSYHCECGRKHIVNGNFMICFYYRTC